MEFWCNLPLGPWAPGSPSIPRSPFRPGKPSRPGAPSKPKESKNHTNIRFTLKCMCKYDSTPQKIKY